MLNPPPFTPVDLDSWVCGVPLSGAFSHPKRHPYDHRFGLAGSERQGRGIVGQPVEGPIVGVRLCLASPGLAKGAPRTQPVWFSTRKPS